MITLKFTVVWTKVCIGVLLAYLVRPFIEKNKKTPDYIHTKTVRAWLKKVGYRCVFAISSYTGVAAVNHGLRMVFLDPRLTTEVQLISLLHECGHIIYLEECLQFSKQCARRTAIPSNLADYEELIIEETGAWAYGEALARRLNITKPVLWADVKETSLKSYYALGELFNASKK
jgi:hypothetical protein